jgi:hypothetical protein
MNTKLRFALGTAMCLAAAVATQAAVITFDGGMAYKNGNPVGIPTDNLSNWDDIDYYEEDGFKLDFINNTAPFAANIGNYYGAGNAVIHGHWNSGDFGDLTRIVVTKVGGGTFDLNYFILTSNTDTGGAPASGNERAFIKNDGGNDILLPPEDWGFPAKQIFLPATYDGINSFEFYAENPVDCFGMDEFYIDEDAPPPVGVPEGGSSFALFGASMLLALGVSSKLKKTARAQA